MNPVNTSKNSSAQAPNFIQTRAQIFFADWLSHHNHNENKDKAIKGMDIKVDAVQMMTDVPECMSIHQIQQATVQDEHLQLLKSLIITAWPGTKDQLHQDIRPYWSFKDDLAVIDGVIMKGRCIIILKILKQHVNHIGIEKKPELFTHKSFYWVNVDNDIQNYFNNDI